MKTILSINIFICFIYANIIAQNGVIKGEITNSINNTALPFVNVAIQGTTIGTTTDINGKYQLTGLKPGQYNLSASFVGFETKTIYEIEVTNSKPSIVDFSLTETVTNLQAVEIKAPTFVKKEESPISLRTIGASEIMRNAGGNRDISKVIQSLPGVAPTVSFRNDIVIRGGSPNENRFYLDDIEVPNINHFATQGSSGGPVGMINVDFIREVDFYSSAFPANRNNSLSSIMNFYLKDGRNDRIGGKFTLGASDMGLTVEGPANENANFIASFRRSYLQFLFKQIGLPFLPTYNDIQFKYKWKLNLKNEITAIGLGAYDEFSLNKDLQKTGNESQKYILGYLPVNNQWNYTFGIKYVHFLKNSYITLVFSRNMLNNEAYKYKHNDESVPDNKILDYKSQEIENKIRFEVTKRINNLKINYGTNYEYSKYNNKTFNKISIPYNQQIILNFYSEIDFFKWGLFGQISNSFFNNRLGLSFGIRSDGNSYDRAMINSAKQLSPRFSLSYNITEHLSFNANTGLYYQLPPYTVLGYRDNAGNLVNKNNKIKYIQAHHLVGGFEYLNNKNLKINIEGFLKYFTQYPFILKDSISLANLGSNFGVIGNEEVKSTSMGRSYGIEFLVQQRLYKGFYGLLTYTFVRSEFKDKNQKYVPSSWDNKHIINITAGKSFVKNWELNIKWRFALGSPYTPFDYDNSRIKANWDITHQGILDFNKLNTKRLSSFHQLDVRVDKKYYLKKIRLNFYVDIQNIYNFKSEQPQILDVIKDINGNELTDLNDPNKYQAKLIDNSSGNVLPTIGIVIEF